MTRAKWLSDGYRALLMVRSTGWTCVRPSNDLLKFDAQPKHFVISWLHASPEPLRSAQSSELVQRTNMVELFVSCGQFPDPQHLSNTLGYRNV